MNKKFYKKRFRYTVTSELFLFLKSID